MNAIAAVVLGGTSLIGGRGSITGAGSVVIKDVPPDSLVAGVPAVVKKKLK